MTNEDKNDFVFFLMIKVIQLCCICTAANHRYSLKVLNMLYIYDPPPDPSPPVFLHCFYALFKYSLEKILACILFFPFPAYSFLAFCFLYFCTFIFVFNSKYICNMVSATAGSAIFIGFFNQLIKFLSLYIYLSEGQMVMRSSCVLRESLAWRRPRICWG